MSAWLSTSSLVGVLMTATLLLTLVLAPSGVLAAGDNIYTYAENFAFKYDNCGTNAPPQATLDAVCSKMTTCSNDPPPPPFTEADWDWETLDGRVKSQTAPNVWRPDLSDQRTWLGELDLWGNRGGKWMDAGYLKVKYTGWYKLFDTLFAESCSKQLNEAAYFRIRNMCNCEGLPRFGNWVTPIGQSGDWWVQQGMEGDSVWLVPDLDNSGDSNPCESCDSSGACEITQLGSVCQNTNVSILNTIEGSDRDFLFTGRETLGGGVGLGDTFTCGQLDHGDGCCAPPPKGDPSVPSSYRGVPIGEFFLVGTEDGDYWNRIEMYHACMHFHDESSPPDGDGSLVGPPRMSLINSVNNYLLGYGDIVKGNSRYNYCLGSVESVHYTPDLETFQQAFDPCPVTPSPSLGAPLSPSNSATSSRSESPTVTTTPSPSLSSSPTAVPTLSLTPGVSASVTATMSGTGTTSATTTPTTTPSPSTTPQCPNACISCFERGCAEECDPIVRFCLLPPEERDAEEYQFDCSDTDCRDCVSEYRQDPTRTEECTLDRDLTDEDPPCYCSDECLPWTGGSGNESCLLGLALPSLASSSSTSTPIGVIVGSTIAGGVIMLALVLIAIGIIIFRKQLASVFIPGYGSSTANDMAADNPTYVGSGNEGENPMFSRGSLQ